MESLNCRPDDLAVVVRVDAPFDDRMLGRVVRTVHMLGLAQSVNNGACLPNVWNVEYRGLTERNGVEIGLPDAWLRPIRDPGDNEADEMVKLLGAAPPTLLEVLQWGGQ